MSKQTETFQALDVVLKERIADGCAIFQGSHQSLPLQMILNERKAVLKPFFFNLDDKKQVLEYRKEDQVISVETGILLSELAAELAANGQFLPCFAQKDYSLLEVINSAETGYFEHSYGIRSLVLGLEVILSGGETIKTGGKVVKNVTGYDLTKLFLGARGTLGLPTSAHIRVYAKPEQTEIFVLTGLHFEALLLLATNLVKSGLPFLGMELVLGCETLSTADFLMVVIGEHNEVIKELVPIIEDHSQKPGGELKKLAAHEQAQYMQSLENEFEHDRKSLTTSLSRSQCKKIYAAVAGESKLKLHFRPGTGRTRLKFQSEDELVRAIEIIRKSIDDDVLDITCADRDFELLHMRLPAADPELSSIKQALKAKFDPSGKMNPLAKL